MASILRFLWRNFRKQVGCLWNRLRDLGWKKYSLFILCIPAHDVCKVKVCCLPTIFFQNIWSGLKIFWVSQIKSHFNQLLNSSFVQCHSWFHYVHRRQRLFLGWYHNCVKFCNVPTATHSGYFYSFLAWQLGLPLHGPACIAFHCSHPIYHSP